MELILFTLLMLVFLPFAVRRKITVPSAIIIFSLIYFLGMSGLHIITVAGNCLQ